MKVVGVMAGTMVDTRMGVELLERQGYCALSYPLSSSCYEQDSLQFLSAHELESIAASLLQDMRAKGAESCLVYCNSLSAAVDFAKREWGLPIITPFHAYEVLAARYEHFSILAANSLAAKHIEAHIKRANPHASFVSVGWLGLVEMIEQGASRAGSGQEIGQGIKSKEIEREEIVDSGLGELLGFLERATPVEKRSALLLACTHFPALIDTMQARTSLEIIDPAQIMLELLARG